MRNIIAIGGGQKDIRGGISPKEIFSFDREIVTLSGKEKPKLLFIPTASRDKELYVDVVKEYFGERLGCEIDVLYTENRKPTIEDLRDRILSADIIYVGGGNTLHMMRKWNKLWIGSLLQEACEKGIIISGMSAGAICWFQNGTSDSKISKITPDAEYIHVSGLDWYHITLCPHHIAHGKREARFKHQLRTHGGIGLALSDYAALHISDDTFRILTEKPWATACKVHRKNGELVYEEIPENTFLPLTYLLKL